MPVGGNFTSCNCGPDVPACASPTEPVATVGLCLADGTPIAVAVVRDCAGNITSEGWINLSTGQFWAGAVPAGAVACGDSRSIQVSGTFCDVDPGTGDVLGLVLIEYSYAADGSIAGVRLVDAATGATYTPAGTITTCPAGVEQPEQDAVVLCDRAVDGTVTAFLRDFRRDENGVIVGHGDYTLDGAPYVPAGAVGACDQPGEEDSPGEPCRQCESHVLCDRIGAADIPTGATSGTLPNGVGWSVTCSNATADGWRWPVFPCSVTAPQVWALDRPVSAVWSTALAQFPPSGPAGAVVMPEGTQAVSIDPDHHWDAATRTLTAGPGATLTGGVSTFRHPGPVTELAFAHTETGNGGAQRHATTAMTVEPAEPIPFLRTTCRGCDGQVLATVDTTLDGDPYTVTGQAGVCEPGQAPERECVAAVQVLRLCDLNPDTPPDADGKVCAVPFLRTLVFDCQGALAQARDTTLDGEGYSPVSAVDCSTAIPALTELEWPLTAISDDPGGTPGRDFLYTLTNPETGQSATVGLSASSSAGTGCAWTGPPAPDHPPIFNNPTTYTYTLDDAARRMDRFTLDFLDLDPFEGIRNLTPVPDAVEWVTGEGVWDGNRVDATVSNSVVRVHWNSPPETISHSYANTGGGLACHSAVLAGYTMRPEGCCSCDPADESPAEPEPCRNSSALLLCDQPPGGAPDPAVTDTDPAPFYPYPVGVPVPGAQTLWDGGTLDLAPGTGPQPGTTGTVNILAATVQAPRPACDTGTARVTVSVTVQQTGPDDGCGPTGHLRLFNGATQAALAVTPVNTPFGYFGTLTVETDVPAADLAAGDIAVALALDAYDDSGGTCVGPRSTGWQLSAFTAAVAYDQAGCETQFLRSVITDCETGEVIAVTDTTLDGQPYEVTGEVGQCEPVAECCQAPPPETRVDVELQSACLTDEASGTLIGRVLVERVYDDQTGELIERRVTDPVTGDPAQIPPGAVLGPCQEPCRDTSRMLLCDAADGSTQVTPGVQDATAADISLVSPRIALPGPYSALWMGGALTFPADPDGTAGDGGQVYRTAIGRLTATPEDCAGAAGPLTVSVRVRNDGPGPGAGYSGGLYLYRGPVELARALLPGSPPVGHQQTLTASVTVTAEQLAAGELFLALVLETFQNTPKTWVADQFTVSGQLDGCAVQFLRTVIVDCTTGQVTATHDTTLDGDPYQVTGQVGECAPTGGGQCCPPELRVDVETESACVVDEASGEVLARVLIERVYDDQSGDLTQTRVTDPVSGDPVDVPAGAVIGSCEAPCPTAFSTECVGVVERSEAAYDNTSMVGGEPGQCGSVQGPTDGNDPAVGPQFGCGGGPYTITSWIVDGVEVIAEDGGRTFSGGVCGPGMHANWAEALINLDPTGATWVVDNQPGCAWFIRSEGGSGTVYGPMTITGPGTVITDGTWILGPAQSCQETQYTKVYRQDCDGEISVIWLDQAGEETTAPDGDLVRCGTGCSPAGGAGLDVEVVALCDVAADTSVPFLRHITYDTGGAVTLVIDTGLDGVSPYTPSGTVLDSCPPEGMVSCGLDPDDPVSGVSGPITTGTDVDPYEVFAGAPDPGHNDVSYGLAASLGGASTVIPPWTLTGNCSSGTQGNGWQAVRLPAFARPACDDGTVTVTLEYDLTNDGPADALGQWVDARLVSVSGGVQTVHDFRGGGSAPRAGSSRHIAHNAVLPAAILAAGDLFWDIRIETRHAGCKGWTVSNVVGAYEYGIEGCTSPPQMAQLVKLCEPLQVAPQPPSPESDLTVLCDTDPDTGTVVQFIRDYQRDASGAVVTAADYTLDSQTYTPVGEVGLCPPEAPPHLVEECRCDDTDGDGIADTDYVEVIQIGADGALTTVGTYTPDLSAPYTPVAPVDCGPADVGAADATGVQARRVELAAGQTWDLDSQVLVQSVTVHAAEGTGEIVTADGASALPIGESVTWSIIRGSETALAGPLTVTAPDGVVTVSFTRLVNL